MNEENQFTVMLESADRLAQSVGAVAIISFVPKNRDLVLTTPVVNVIDIQPEILRDPSMESVVEYCTDRVMDAVLQYRMMTKSSSGVVVAVFPYAILIYDIENTDSEFSFLDYKELADPEVLHSVLSLALEIAHDGREGRPIGTAFIVGDIDEIKRWSHQGVINPYKGHSADVRDVMNEANWESIKEFAQLDGAFIVGKDGIVEAAGRFLDADGRDVAVQSGLGGRHLAAAAITKVTPSVGITVSESGGVIRIFVAGKAVSVIRTDIRLQF